MYLKPRPQSEIPKKVKEESKTPPTPVLIREEVPIVNVMPGRATNLA